MQNFDVTIYVGLTYSGINYDERDTFTGPTSSIHRTHYMRKPVFRVSDQVRHKPGCTAQEDGKTLEISDLESRGVVLSVL